MVKSLFLKCAYGLGLILLGTYVNAQTKHSVLVGDSFFNPASLNVKVGDTVSWSFTGNMQNHTTTSSTIPSGAASWDQPINTANPTFNYVVTKAGTYNYVCTPHASFMKGTITATVATAVANINQDEIYSYPNPANNKITIASTVSQVTVIDMQGRIVLTWNKGVSSNSIDVSHLSKGTYILNLQVKGQNKLEKLIINE